MDPTQKNQEYFYKMVELMKKEGIDSRIAKSESSAYMQQYYDENKDKTPDEAVEFTLKGLRDCHY